jgi:hypothetical protein
MKYQHALLFIILILYDQNIDKIDTFRCAKNCWIGPVELSNKHPFLVPCDVIEIDPKTIEYTAVIAIRFSNNYILGVLDAKARGTNVYATLLTALELNKHSTVSMINYNIIQNEFTFPLNCS